MLAQDYIGGIRKAYEKDWESADMRTRQMAVALYFIDKLALRAGHEKDEDEADTVGCCTLKVRLQHSPILLVDILADAPPVTAPIGFRSAGNRLLQDCAAADMAQQGQCAA